MANGGGEPRPRRTGWRLRARRTRRDPNGCKRSDRQKGSYASSHETHHSLVVPFGRLLDDPKATDARAAPNPG